jgi:hypothetical protein
LGQTAGHQNKLPALTLHRQKKGGGKPTKIAEEIAMLLMNEKIQSVKEKYEQGEPNDL